MARRGLRVVAGEAGGLRLVAPKGARPTTDRVREAVFAALGPGPVEDASVLDLFAGSGALGIEALSRGASRAVLVDSDRHAAEACIANLATTRFSDRASVHRSTVAAFLGAGPPDEAPFGLVCCDPPYELSDAEVGRVLDGLAAPAWLAPDAVVVIERPAGAAPGASGFEACWQRRYGDTLVVILRMTQDPPKPR